MRVRRPRALLALATALAVAVVCCVAAMPTDRFDRFERFDAVAAADDTAAASDGDAAAFGVFSEVEADVDADADADVAAAVDSDAAVGAGGEPSDHSAAKHAGFGDWVKMAWRKDKPKAPKGKAQKAKPEIDNLKCADAGVPELPGLYEWATAPHDSADDRQFVVRYVGKADGRLGLRQRCNAYMRSGVNFGGHLNEQFAKAIVTEGQDLWYRWRAEPSWPPSEADFQEMHVLHTYHSALPVDNKGKLLKRDKLTTKQVKDRTSGFVGAVVGNSRGANAKRYDPVFEWNTQGTGDATYFAQLARRHKHFADQRQDLLDRFNLFVSATAVLLKKVDGAAKQEVFAALAIDLKCKPEQVSDKLLALSHFNPHPYDPKSTGADTDTDSDDVSADVLDGVAEEAVKLSMTPRKASGGRAVDSRVDVVLTPIRGSKQSSQPRLTTSKSIPFALGDSPSTPRRDGKKKRPLSASTDSTGKGKDESSSESLDLRVVESSESASDDDSKKPTATTTGRGSAKATKKLVLADSDGDDASDDESTTKRVSRAPALTRGSSTPTISRHSAKTTTTALRGGSSDDRSSTDAPPTKRPAKKGTATKRKADATRAVDDAPNPKKKKLDEAEPITTTAAPKPKAPTHTTKKTATTTTPPPKRKKNAAPSTASEAVSEVEPKTKSTTTTTKPTTTKPGPPRNTSKKFGSK